jgi:hydroxyacylglutathione hydrolase
LALEEIEAAAALRMSEGASAALVDIRPPEAFARGHLKGTLSIPFSPRGFAARAWTIAPSGKPLVLLGDDAQKLEAAAAQATAGGISVAGVVHAGPDAWVRNGLPVQSIGLVSTTTLRERLGTEGVRVLDVREPMEWETGHVPGAILIALGELRARMGELDRKHPLLVICESGTRSSSAASILQAAGFADVTNVFEGTAGCRRAGFELQHTAM